MNMKLEVLPAREAIARHAGIVHVAVRVTPEAVRRNAVSLALVIDASGSMAEPAGRPGEGRSAPSKMRFVKEAAHFLVDLLRAGDQLSIVAFEESARTVLRTMPITDASRAEIHGAIESLRPGGSTNLMAGLELGIASLGARGRRRNGSRRVVVLSDGETNAGEKRPEAIAARAAEAAGAGVTVSALGVGFDYNIDLLRRLSDAGGGDYHHVEDPRSVEQALMHELLGAAAVSARGVEVEISAAGPATIAGPNLNGYPATVSAGSTRVHIGELARPRDVVFEITTPVTFTGDVLRVEAVAEGSGAGGEAFRLSGACALRVVAPEDVAGAGVDPDIVELVLRLLQARAETEFASSVDQGNAGSARLALALARDDISGTLQAYGRSSSAALSELDAIESRLDAGTFDRVAAKSLYMAAHAAQRSRTASVAVPFERSYWVDAPRLLAGCYPGDLDPAIAAQKVRALADAGIRTIVSLMVPGEPSHGGRAFRSYTAEAQRLGLDVLSHPIPGGGVVDRDTLIGILNAIDASIAGGRPVYVHGWGGRGRTGMVVASWLVRHGLAPSEGAVARLRALRRDCPDAAQPSPENRAQARVVSSWVRGL